MQRLIIYATKYGSTAEVARRLKQRSKDQTDVVNVMTDSIPPLTSYDTVILGGSIYMGKVQKQLTRYIDRHLPELLTKKIGLFLCAGHPKEETRQEELRSAFPETLFRKAAAKDVLGYAFDFEKMHFFDRLIMRQIKGDGVSTAEYPDQRISEFLHILEQK